MTDEQLQNIRHSFAHLLAASVKDLWPGTHNAIGPAIKDGFYQDFSFGPKKISTDDLPKIEKRMRKILTQWKGFAERTIDANEARKLFADNPYKLELIEDLARDNTSITVNDPGNFLDLCKGGHASAIADMNPDAFALTKVSGAYWRNDQNREQLQRIYGVAFGTPAELTEYLAMLAEAEKRDHRKLGKQLNLYAFHETSPGAVFWHANGMVIWNELERLLRETLTPAGYGEVQTPLMIKPKLFEQSGHLAHYKENMFRVEGKAEEFYLKPMNCPEGALIYATRKYSYRDLPVRLAEIGRIHRNELSGTLGGLFRVRQITQDDGHIFCRPDQLEQEITNVLELSNRIYALFGLKPSYYLSTKPDDAMGTAKQWEQAEAALIGALRANKLSFDEKPKDGTFYAPKIDIDITDSIGRRWQLCTIQADLVMVPSLPGVTYTDTKGRVQKPIVVHRAIYGSFERFIGILVEHYAGAFPTWLSPIQVAIIPVGAAHVPHAEELARKLREEDIRVEVHSANETVGKKIRETAQQKIPYMLVVGDKELRSTKLMVRKRGEDAEHAVARTKFVQQLKREIETRSS